MTNKNETFSAFMDSELTTAESKEQIGEASHDVNLRYRMQRYQYIGDVMRGEAGESIQLDFAAKISAQISQLDPMDKPKESVQQEQVKTESFLSRWFRPLTGMAVAASVAWVAVVSLQGLMDVDSRTGEFTKQANEIAVVSPQEGVSDQVNMLAQLPVQTNVMSVSVPVLSHSAQDHLQWSSAQSQAVSQSKLNAYLVTHTEYSTSMQGIIPQARVAGFDVNP